MLIFNVDAKSGLEAISVYIEAIRSTIPQAELLEFEAGLANLGFVAESVGPLSTAEALATTSESVAVKVDLTPEQRERATKLQTAIAERFSTGERKLTPEDFGVISVGEGEARKVASEIINWQTSRLTIARIFNEF